MNWPDFHKKKDTERLATPQELAQIGGAPTDPMTESQILALIEEQMSEELEKAAEESAAKAKVRAMRELAAMLGPESSEADKKAAEEKIRSSDTQAVNEAQENPLASLSEAERVAAEFFGAGEVEHINEVKELKEVKEVLVQKEVFTVREAMEEKGIEDAEETESSSVGVETEEEQVAHAPAASMAAGVEETRELRTELLAVAEALDQHRHLGGVKRERGHPRRFCRR